jgi:hypothetical protein
MNKFFKVYPKFSSFAKEISKLDLENPDDYAYNSRADIYERLRLPMKTFSGDKKSLINDVVKKHFGLEDFLFSIIKSNNVSQIHTDTHYKKDSSLQRYCNLAFPIQGNFNNRITFWPKLDKQDSLHCFKNSFVLDDSLTKYKNSSTWESYIEHKLFQPVLLNTSVPHAASGDGPTLFAYITLIGKSYEDCAALYTEISNSATT